MSAETRWLRRTGWGRGTGRRGSQSTTPPRGDTLAPLLEGSGKFWRAPRRAGWRGSRQGEVDVGSAQSRTHTGLFTIVCLRACAHTLRARTHAHGLQAPTLSRLPRSGTAGQALTWSAEGPPVRAPSHPARLQTEPPTTLQTDPQVPGTVRRRDPCAPSRVGGNFNFSPV